MCYTLVSESNFLINQILKTKKEKKFHTKFKTGKSHVSTSPKVGQVYVKKKDIGFSLG